MGKSCLNKLRGNVSVNCIVPQVGVKNIYLMHAEDVTLTESGSNPWVLATASFAPSAAVIRVEGYKQNIQITSAIRTMDASAKLDFSVMFKFASQDFAAAPRVRSLLGGKFYVLVEYQNGMNTLIGYTSPLECSGMDFDSNANAGFITVTLTAPEGSAGNYLMDTTADAVTSIKSKAGV